MSLGISSEKIKADNEQNCGDENEKRANVLLFVAVKNLVKNDATTQHLFFVHHNSYSVKYL